MTRMTSARYSPGRRHVLRAVALGGLSIASPVFAEPHRIRRVGWLTNVKNYGPAGNRAINAFRARLAELGWAEGRNFIFEPRWAENQTERLPALAAELVSLQVDVIVAQTNAAALAAKNATATIPIVMTGATDPVVFGIVESLARPGANVTGVTGHPGAGFYTKMVQFLKEAAPRVSRLAILGASALEMDALEAAAPGFALTTVRAPARSHHEVPAALEGALHDEANGLFVLATSVNDPNRKAIIDFALLHRWPAIGADRNFPKEGGLMSYWTDWDEVRRQTADYVDKILSGANPADLPIQQPTKFELVVNLRTARELGLALSPSLRLRADELIQ